MQSPAEQGHGLQNTSPAGRKAEASQERPVAASSTGPSRVVRILGDGGEIHAANAGDHPLILDLLVHVHEAQLAEDFQSRLDEPGYRPNDRLIVRKNRALLGHVRVPGRICWFEGQRTSTVNLEDFAVLPEYAGSRYEDDLIAAAENLAAAEGALVALVRTERREPFARRGWSMFRAQGHTRASASAVLAHLDAQEATRRRRRPTIAVRTWRHFELDLIREIYDAGAKELWGPLNRTEAAWQWLVGRKAHDQILLAVHQPRTEKRLTAAGADEEHVVGYAVVRGACIMEMVTLPEFSGARTHLVARACRDAIDRDHHGISLYTPPGDPMHELLVTAGGAWVSHASSGEPRWMAKLLSVEKWVDRLFPVWRRRAQQQRIHRPLDLGVNCGGDRRQFVLTRRSSRVEPATTGPMPTHWIECDVVTFQSLLLGNLSLDHALQDGALAASPGLPTRVVLSAIFAPRLFWQSPWELTRL